METPIEPRLGRAEELALRHLADDGETYLLDWVALQHLKGLGLVEEVAAVWKITDDGRRAIRNRRP